MSYTLNYLTFIKVYGKKPWEVKARRKSIDDLVRRYSTPRDEFRNNFDMRGAVYETVI